MKSKLLLGAIVATASLVAVPVAFAEPAVHISDLNCGMLDGNGDGFQVTDAVSLNTLSKNGVVILKCQAKDIPNDTGRAVHWDFASTGARCAVVLTTGGAVTEDWKETVSANGNATLICRYKTP